MDVTSDPPSSVESDTFVFMEKTHPNQMLEKLNRLRLNNTLCDVILCCGGKQFPCHRTVLASFSSYFEAMFTTGMMESRQEKVDMMDVEPQEIDLLVGYAYTSQVVISSDNVQALLAASNLLGVTAVQEACCHYMERQLDMKNCVGIHCFAELHSCQMLMKHSMDFILEHFSYVYQQEEFLSLSEDKLTEILASDDLHASKEELVFDAAMMWLNHCPTRTQSFEKVVEQIRLAFISPTYLQHVTETLGEVESQVCQRLISEAKDQRPCRSTLTGSYDHVILLVGEGMALRFVKSLDPLTKQKKNLACLPVGVSGAGLVVSGSYVYLAGGVLVDYSRSREVWRYDVSRDSWLKMAPMNHARTDFGLVMLDGYVFAVGGQGTDKTRQQSVERYETHTNTWQLMDSVGLPDHWDSSAVVALDGLIYAIGNRCSGREMAVRNPMFTYNPKTSVWTEAARMRGPRVFSSTACTLNGKIYVLGGYTGCVRSGDEVRCYNPETNQWSKCAPMKNQFENPRAVAMDGKIYALGACRFPPEIEQYNEETDTWKIVGKMTPSSGKEFSCTSLRLRKDVHAEAERKQEATCTKCNKEFRSRSGRRKHSNHCNTPTH